MPEFKQVTDGRRLRATQATAELNEKWS